MNFFIFVYIKIISGVRMKKLLTLFIIFLASFSLYATDSQTAYSLVKKGKAVLFDVREKDEIKSGMIDLAVWFPKSKITSDPNWKKDFLKLSNGKKIFLYCKSGMRSRECQKTLKENGIESESIGGYEQLKSELPTHIPKE